MNQGEYFTYYMHWYSEKRFDFTFRLAVVCLNLKLVNSVILLSMIVK
jgi:hypothetical protein